MPDQAEAAINIQRTWRGHHDRQAVEQKKAQREKARQEYFEKANMVEAIIMIQTRARILIARLRRRMRTEVVKRAAHVPDDHQAAEKAALVEKSATNIQRTWRGHQGRERVKQLSSEREKKRQAAVDRANLLEAVLVIQTRARIFLAKCRKNLLLRNRGEIKYTPSAQERAIAAHKAATDIQRIWHGHEARQKAKQRANERKQKMQRHIAEANRLEALLLIQTRARILIAQARRRLREQAIIRAGHLHDAHEAAQKAANFEKSATNIQRSWRGHQDRKRVKVIAGQRQKARQEYLDKANMLEAVIMIQTRARIMIAKARRRIYERTLKQISPARHLIDAEQAATDVQRVWRGHHERQTKIAEKRQQYEKKRQDYFDRANMLEAVLMIQTRMRVFRAKLRLKKLKQQKEANIHQKLKIEVGSSDNVSPVTTSPTNNNAVPRPPASPPNGSNSRGYTLLGGARSSGSSSSRNALTKSPPQEHQHDHHRRASAPNGGTLLEERPDRQQQTKMSESAKLPMYRVPNVSPSGFFVRSFEENVANNVYQGMLSNSGSLNNNNNQQQQNNNNNAAQPMGHSKTSPDVSGRGEPLSPQQQQARKVQTRIAISEQPKSSQVLESPEAIRKFVLDKKNNNNNSETIVKQTALHALFDVVGSDKLPAIVEVWDTVTPFATTESLTVDQMILILEQLRAIKIVTDTKKSLEKAESK